MSLAASSVSRAFSRDLTAVTDRDLVATAVSGVEGSFEELVRRYQRPISAYVYRMVGNYESALDLTQEIFIKVYNSLQPLPRGVQVLHLDLQDRPQLGRRSSAPQLDSRTVARRSAPKAISLICRLRADV